MMKYTRPEIEIKNFNNESISAARVSNGGYIDAVEDIGADRNFKLLYDSFTVCRMEE